jgi:hypothetical protein
MKLLTYAKPSLLNKAILHTLGDKLFSGAVEDLNLSLKNVRSQKD